jgi:Protein of unknown function (DUF3060)
MRRRDSFGWCPFEPNQSSTALNNAQDVRSTAMTAGGWTVVSRSVTACLVAVPVALVVGAPSAQAKNGDTHITSIGSTQTIDCNESTLIVNGSGNTINALGSCWAVTVQGAGNLIVADNVVNDITVYGSDQTVFYKSGEPVVWDRGRELGMMNRIDRIPA